MTGAPLPRVSVVIPTYGRCASLRRTLTALRRQTLAPAEYEVVVVVDGSEDGTREMLAGFDAPFALVSVWQANRGCAAARNAGIRRSRAPLVVFLDDDMEPSEGFLEAHLRAHAGGGPVAALGAVPIRIDGASPPIVRYVAAKFNRHLAGLAAGRPIGFRSFYTGNCSLRREVLDRTGLFDESFRIYGNEDSELAVRLLHAGVALHYCPEALAYQHFEKGFDAVARDHEAKGRTAVLCGRLHVEAAEHVVRVLRHPGSRKRRLARTVLLGLSARSRAMPRAVVRTVLWLERRAAPGLPTCYRIILDYFYCLGARAALREAGLTPASMRAAALRHGERGSAA